MNQIGRRIYYEKTTGNVILDTGERSGYVVPTTIDQDFENYAVLSLWNRKSVGILELEYGQYAADFAACSGYRVDVSGETPTLVFSYPDPSDPEAPPAFQKPLSEEIAETKQAIAELTILLAQVGGA